MKAALTGLLCMGATLAGCEQQAPPSSERPKRVTAQKPSREFVDGYEVIRATRREPSQVDEKKQREHWIMEPNQPDPEQGEFTLEEATAGLGDEGSLVAEIHTQMGILYCDLYGQKAPTTVANFVGLARGLRPFWDARAGRWTKRRYYDGTRFHRVIPESFVQGGDHFGDGTGRVGYEVAPEALHIAHDEAGQLCVASYDNGRGGAQFLITDGPLPRLDGRFGVFGQCIPEGLVYRMARVPQRAETHRPLTPIVIERVVIRRQVGGAHAALEQPQQTTD